MAQALDPVFQALSDDTRRAMLERLQQGPATVSDLAEPLPMTLAGVVQHLHILQEAKLVRSSKAGRVRTCELVPEGLGAARVWIERVGVNPERNPGRPARARALRIEHALQRCSLGLLLVASTSKGVCAVLFGDSAGELKAELQRRFPEAELRPASKALQSKTDRVRRAVESAGAGRGVPLDLHGTPFQRQVWQALQRIPRGHTTSYGALARSLGQPKAVRAVASACGANPVAVLVPCHRVVGQGGKLTGYRWGIERKRTLLQREAQTR